MEVIKKRVQHKKGSIEKENGILFSNLMKLTGKTEILERAAICFLCSFRFIGRDSDTLKSKARKSLVLRRRYLNKSLLTRIRHYSQPEALFLSWWLETLISQQVRQYEGWSMVKICSWNKSFTQRKKWLCLIPPVASFFLSVSLKSDTNI